MALGRAVERNIKEWAERVRLAQFAGPPTADRVGPRPDRRAPSIHSKRGLMVWSRLTKPRRSWLTALLLADVALAEGALPRMDAAPTPPSTIAFENRSPDPALVKLVGVGTVRIEVPAFSRRTVSADAGEYYILVRYGSDSTRWSTDQPPIDV